MNERPPQVRIAAGLPFALRFIAVGAAVFAIGILVTALTGGTIWDKSADRAMTLREMLRLAALLALGGAGLWWTGGWLRRSESDS